MTFSRQLLVVYINTNYIKNTRTRCVAGSPVVFCIVFGLLYASLWRNNSGIRESCSYGINYLYLIKSKPPFRLTVWIIRIDAHRFHWPESKKKKKEKVKRN